MACSYNINGQPNAVITEVLQYMEDVAPGQRSAADVLKILKDLKVGNENSYLNDNEGIVLKGFDFRYSEDFDYLNQGFSISFDGTGPLVSYDEDASTEGTAVFNLSRIFQTANFTGQSTDTVRLKTKTDNKPIVTKTPLEKVLNTITADRGWALTENGEQYTRTVNGEVETVPRITSLKKGEYTDSEYNRKASARGTIIDSIFRDAITVFNASGRVISKKEIKKLYDEHQEKGNTDLFNDDFISNLKDILVQIFEDISKRNLVLVSDIPTINGVFKGQMYAGTIDFLAYNAKGEFFIFDLKTSFVSRKSSYKKGKFDTQINDAIQLTAYSEAFFQLTGVRPKSAAIYAVQTTLVNGEYVAAELEESTSKKGVKYLTLYNNKLGEARSYLNLPPLTQNQAESFKNKAEERLRKEKRQAFKEALENYEEYKLIKQDIIAALTAELDLLSRQQQNKATERLKTRIQVIKRDLKRVKEIDEDIQSFHDFAVFAQYMAETALDTLDAIEEDFANTEFTEEEMLTLLNKINSLKSQLDLFYSDNQSESVLNKLQTYIEELQEDEISSTFDVLVSAITDMQKANKDYLDVALPIQAKLISRHLNFDVNTELDAMIELIDKNNMLQGLDRSDPRKQDYVNRLGKWEGLKALNKVQLEEKKISEATILKELQVTHKDPSAYSMWADPLIYSDQAALQGFALSVKANILKARDSAREKNMALAEPLKAFIAKQGGILDNTSRLYQDMYELIEIPRHNAETGEYEYIKVLAFVQPIDVVKFYAERDKFYKEARKLYNYPENPADLEEYFEDGNPDGKAYLIATSEWHKENTIKVKGAEEMRDRLQADILNITTQLGKTSDYGKKQQLFIELSAAKTMLKRIWRNNQFVGPATQPDPAKYSNAKYTNMPAAAKEYYNVLFEAYKAEQIQNGETPQFKNSWENFSYVAPSVRIEDLDNLASNGIKAATKSLISDRFSPQITDTEYVISRGMDGEAAKMVPMHFTNTVEHQLVSRDLTDSVMRYIDMSERYRANSKMLGMANLMHTAVARRDVTLMSPNGEPYKNGLYKRAGFDRPDVVKGIHSNAYKTLTSFIDQNIFMRSKIVDPRTLDKTVTKQKIVAGLTGLTATVGLALNPLQATNQLLLDTLIGNQEAWTREVISPKNAAYASRIMYLELQALKLGASRAKASTKTRSKLAMFLDWSEADQTFKGTPNTRSTARRWASRDLAFILQTIPDGLTTAKKALAIADSYRGKLKDANGNVILNKAGKPANLFEVLEVKGGVVKLRPDVANFNKIEYVSKLHGLTKKANQMKGNFDNPMLDRTTWGPLFTLYRRYIQPGLRKAFGKGHGTFIDSELGIVTNGYYGSMTDLILSAIRNPKILVQPKKWSKVQQSNAIRVGYIAAVQAIIFTSLSMLAAALENTDDEDEKYWINFAMYQMLRLRTETMAFANPAEAWRLLQSPTATVNPVLKMYNLLKYLGLYVAGSEESLYQRDYGQYEKGDPKFLKYLKESIPFWNGMLKNPEEAKKFFQL